MRIIIQIYWTCIVFKAVTLSDTPTDDTPKDCFCKLYGEVGDCSCKVEKVEMFNNLKVFPRLNSLLRQDFFKYWKVNLYRKCPFWVDDSRCALRDCAVDNCDAEKLPSGLKQNESNKKYSNPETCSDDELGHLNTSLSRQSKDAFEDWKVYDDKQENFCEFDDDNSEDANYVDLLLNPERYTGYKGPSAHRVWKAIYEENCFKPDYRDYITVLRQGSGLQNEGMCLEKRTFYRLISGMHTSINTHLTAMYFFPGRNLLEEGTWRPNLAEFKRRFEPNSTSGAGPQWLRNLYFTYLVELRALAKAAPYLKNELYYTGSEEKDAEVRKGIIDLLNIIEQFDEHFDESKLFRDEETKALKTAFKAHFRNVSLIMDCVGCDKCKLWGKLQVTGMGTALKILFSDGLQGLFDTHTPPGIRPGFQLRRNEIVALFNGFGRLAQSIVEVEEFRKMLLKN